MGGMCRSKGFNFVSTTIVRIQSYAVASPIVLYVTVQTSIGARSHSLTVGVYSDILFVSSVQTIYRMTTDRPCLGRRT